MTSTWFKIFLNVDPYFKRVKEDKNFQTNMNDWMLDILIIWIEPLIMALLEWLTIDK